MSFLSNKCVLFLTLLFFFLLNSFIFCLSDESQNIEVIFPITSPPPPSLSPALAPPTRLSPPSITLTPPPKAPPGNDKPSKKTIATAVGVTALCSLVAAALLFFLFTRYADRKKKDDVRSGAGSGGGGAAVHAAVAGGGAGGGARLQTVAQTEFTRFDGEVKGVIIDEDGLDVLYWRNLEGSQKKSGSFNKDVLNNKATASFKRNFSRGKSSSSTYNQVHPKDDQKLTLLDSRLSASDHASHNSSEKLSVVNENHAEAAPLPPPPLPPPENKAPPPPPPPIPGKKGPAPPPPPPLKGKAAASALPRPPPAPKRSQNGKAAELSAVEVDDESSDQVKLKPLHWEKVNVVNRDHSMVWDKLDRGSFQYNGDMMEALFGAVAKNRKSPKENAENKDSANPSAKIFILDSRRSQNIAIVIRSLGISRTELIDGLSEGKGLNPETLEKLTRMAPTREEKIQILAFDGDIGNLADAESFLYHLLKAVPSAFTRVNAMLFRYTFDSEIEQLKDILNTLDSACTELRSRGVFLKLLEAILKAGNRLNAGTARGNAKAFNLTALRKLSDYKSSDGKTTLLHFVVHEVVRNEGRRCVMNRNNSLTQSNSHTSASQNEPKSKEEQEKEFLKLGLPLVGGLSSEFSNVLKSANIDYDSISSISNSLESRVAETRQLVLTCGADNGGGAFIKEMKEFLEEAEEQIKVVQEEHAKVMELVKKTTQYYQSGAFKDKQPLQLFSIVKDFLGMVDRACVEITRSLQQKKATTNASGPSTSDTSASSTTPDVLRTKVTFPKLPDHFLSGKSEAGDSDDDER